MAVSTDARRQEANLMMRKSDRALLYGRREEFVLISRGGNETTMTKQGRQQTVVRHKQI
jgi:hypothetical protein